MSDPRALTDLLRELAPQVLGVTLRRSGDFTAAEDAVQEALLAAFQQWPESGVPDNPRGWLIGVANRRLIDAVRSDAARRERETAEFRREVDTAPLDSDDTLTMLRLCCHPELPPASAIALTLRAAGGLTTAEIAGAFFVPEATMSQRITRAKRKLAALGRPFSGPPGAEVDVVLRVLYLTFAEGYAGSSGERVDLAAEAIRLTRLLRRERPADSSVAGLLALLLLNHSRRHARVGPHGELIPLDEQNRSRWDRPLIVEGLQLATEAVRSGLENEYTIQAAIAALHAQSRSTETTEWTSILTLYRRLEQLNRSPMVTLNRAVATAMVHGPEAALHVVGLVTEPLAQHHRLYAVRAHLHELGGNVPAALADYRRAAALTTSQAERDYLTLRAARLRS